MAGVRVVPWDPFAAGALPPRLPALDTVFCGETSPAQVVVYFADDVDVYMATVRGGASALQACLKGVRNSGGFLDTKILLSCGTSCPKLDRSVAALARCADAVVPLVGDPGSNGPALARHAPEEDDGEGGDPFGHEVASALSLDPFSSTRETWACVSLATIEASSRERDDASLGSMAADLRRALCHSASTGDTSKIKSHRL
jgi:hypothetical protein